MIKIINGDLLKSDCDIICHQVNCQGVMGGGIAKQIAALYPECELQYKKYCEVENYEYSQLSGKYLKVYTVDYDIINCFTQKFNFDTDYEALKKCFSYLLSKHYDLKIGIPYKYGCGIANGDWNTVSKILNDISDEYNCVLYVYKLEEK